ncbi:hypothetical protein NIES932_28720 [Raphidiopsis curvata NIES-932]|nr:hypothetical protein [Cyanobacteria bacterium REEB444]BAZ91365.1 hypothetical protein NIES932_28720 [Raphidiopsis curvata NIES-932]
MYQTNRGIILFELNEVPLRIIDEFCLSNPRSTLAKRLPQCNVYETISEDCIRLSPWVTWPSVYRGVNDEHHMIEHFGQDLSEVDEEYPPIWKILTRHKISTGVFGTLHTYPMPKNLSNYAFYVPDTFAAGKECFPSSINAFQDFNLSMARESPRNVSDRIHWLKVLTMLRSLPELGIRPQTLASVAGQVAIERVQSWKSIRRRTFQPMIAFDIFMTWLNRTRPRFATFFTNHVASSMHRYWAATFPQDYRLDEYQFDQSWQARYGKEISFTMGKFDQMFSRLVNFVDANPSWLLFITTSMGQEATTARPLETQLYIADLTKFMFAMGLSRDCWTERPAMAPRVSVFVSPDHQGQLHEALSSMRINGQMIEWHSKGSGFFNIRFGQENLHEGDCKIEVLGKEMTIAELGMDNIEIQDKSNTTAYHVHSGSLVIYDPKNHRSVHQSTRPQISTLDIAPFILSQLGVPLPDYMRHPGSLVSI